MIGFPPGVHVWLATGHCDMRKGFPGLALLVQEKLKSDPHGGHLFVFRGRRGDLIKVIWHDGQGACLFSKRLERGRFIWPTPSQGAVTISPAQLGYLLEGRSTHGVPSSQDSGARRAGVASALGVAPATRPQDYHHGADRQGREAAIVVLHDARSCAAAR